MVYEPAGHVEEPFPPIVWKDREPYPEEDGVDELYDPDFWYDYIEEEGDNDEDNS